MKRERREERGGEGKERPPFTPFPLRRDEERDRPFFSLPSFTRDLLAVLCIWTRALPSHHADLLPHSLSLFLSRSLPEPSAGFAERARSTCFASSYCFLYDKWLRGPLTGSPTAYASFRALDGSIDREGGAAKFERRTRRHGVAVWKK